MNRTRLIYALGAVGAMSGFATTASASTTTIYPDIGFDANNTAIALPGVSAPDFHYLYSSYNFGKMLFGNQYLQAGPGEYLSAPNVTGPLASQTYDNTIVYTFQSNFPKGVNSVDLTFDSGGTTYYGEAYFGNDYELTEIQYGPAGVPEPEAWALLLAGTGLAGAAMRARRRSANLAA